MSRTLTGLATAASLVAATLALAPSATAAPAPALPRTGFELSDGATWTTLEQEQTFLRAVDRASDRVSIRELGRTREGRPLQLVTIGSGPRTQAQVAAGSSVLLLCSQHGDEPAGREACLSTVRDLAGATDAKTVRLLERTTVLVVPTANPDGRAADTRTNSQGVDINRDHLALQTVEARSTARIIRDLKPDVLHDAHEYGGTADVYDRDLIHLWPRNRNVDSQIYDYARELNDEYVSPLVSAAGFSTGIYGIFNGPDGEPIAQVAGDEDERILRNMGGLRHVNGMLIETRIDDGLENDQAGNNRRVDAQGEAITATFAFLRDNAPGLARQTAAAARRATVEGRTGDKPFYLGGADNRLPTTSEVVLDPPCAYRLTAGQYRDVRGTLTLHGIEVTRSGSSSAVTVSMAQPAQPVIPFLLDERAEYEIATGTPVACR